MQLLPKALTTKLYIYTYIFVDVYVYVVSLSFLALASIPLLKVIFASQDALGPTPWHMSENSSPLKTSEPRQIGPLPAEFGKI